MATKKNIEEIIATLSGLWPKQGASVSTNTGIDMYWMALKDVSDKKLASAVAEYMEDGEYFPKPSDLRSLIKELGTQKHEKEERDRYTCTKCGSEVTLIMGTGERGRCWECDKGIKKDKQPKAKRAEYENPDSVIIQDRTMCNVCHKVGDCYKDQEKDSWRCLDCYTGLTKDQRAQRFQDLFTMIEDKTFVPKWAEELADKYPDDMPLTLKRLGKENDPIPF